MMDQHTETPTTAAKVYTAADLWLPATVEGLPQPGMAVTLSGSCVVIDRIHRVSDADLILSDVGLVSRSRVIIPLDDATKPGGPFSPNKPAITRTAVGIGVIVFLGIAVGLSFIDDRIKSAWDVESFIGANLLGIIPDLTSMKDEEKYTLLLENKQAPGGGGLSQCLQLGQNSLQTGFPQIHFDHQHDSRRR